MKIASRSILKEEKCCFEKKSCSINKYKPNTVKANIKTSEGEILIELDSKKAPKTVDNFIKYAKEGQYQDTIFHRIISNFMIQGGEYKSDKSSKKPTREPIHSEASNGLKNLKGTIAMARTNNPNSAKAQFFINTRDNPFLNQSSKKNGYTVFGKVVKGMDVVNKIRISKTDNKNWPQNPTVIYDVKIES